ncbi:olfactory receptor 1009-like [Bufo bufo]|uniref:olfactory receptor 1009-like n=1 Tax=Bufo bufo TaxID=8384 RepID=UPI001ABE3B82|nr:olfactory receptor 1009-like [Bufo bufo]
MKDLANQTTIAQFILLGLTKDRSLQFLLFVLFLIIYACSFLSNLCLLALIIANHHLHTPMYFFLGHLSFVDLCYSSTITPRMLADFTSESKSISSLACATQMFSFALFAISEILLVTAMSYDRYVAICRPLVYHNIMNKSTCWGLVFGTYFSSCLASITHTITVFKFPLCGSHEINHFYCDIPPLLKLTCAHSHIRKLVVFSMAFVIGLVSFFGILMSYVLIIYNILRIHSADGRRKAFSTCASHLTVVISFYCTAFGIYFQPSMGLNSDGIDKVFSIFYTVASPLLNPIIYSFKNADVKMAIMHILSRSKILARTFSRFM